MADRRVPIAACPASRAYGELRVLSGLGTVVGREQPLAQEALRQLGLGDKERADREQDRVLLDNAREREHAGAFLGLRCRVSWAVEQRLRVLEKQFTRHYGLELVELAAFALDDRGQPLPFHVASAELLQAQAGAGRTPEPFGVEVVRSYNPELSGLGSWTRQMLLGHPPLRRYLQESGVRLISDWALLADASHRQVREAVANLGKDITPQAAEALHRRYLPLYRREKLLFVQQTGRQRGWLPDTDFLREVNPGIKPEATRKLLQAIAADLRRWASGRWEQQDLQRLQAEAGEPRSGQAGSDALHHAAELEQARQDRQVLELVDRVGKECMAALLKGMTDESSEGRIWRAWADGLPQRQIAERCGTNQARVSRTLQLQGRARMIAGQALSRLRVALATDPESPWSRLFHSREAFQEAEGRLLNHLLEPEQPDGVTPLRRWVQHALPAAASHSSCSGGPMAGVPGERDGSTGSTVGDSR